MFIVGNPLWGFVSFVVTVLLPIGIVVLVLYCVWRGREARLRGEGVPPGAGAFSCSRCGQRLRVGTVICTYCGTIQREVAGEQNATSPE